MSLVWRTSSVLVAVLGLILVALGGSESVQRDSAPVSLALHAPWGALTQTEPVDARQHCRKARAVPHHAGQQPVDPRSVVPGPRPCLHWTGAPAYEPTLGLTRNGWVFFKGVPQRRFDDIFEPGGTQTVFRSKDGGRTWEDVGGPVEPSIIGDPYLTVDRDTDRVFAIDLRTTCAQLSFSDDYGDSWTVNPHVCGETDHQTVFTGPPVSSRMLVYPNIVYYCAIGAGATGALGFAAGCLKSLDGGLTFTPTGDLAYPLRQDCLGLTGHGVVGPDGTVYLPTLWCGQPHLAMSNDEGLTWTRVRVANLGGPGHEAGVAADGQGNVYYVWIAADRKPYLAISRNGGRTWGKPINIGPPVLSAASLPGIDVGRPGRIAVDYMGTPTGTRWNGYITISTNALSENPLFYTTSVNPPRRPLVVGTCGTERCHSAGDFFDVAIGPDGTAWASFVDTRSDCILTDLFTGEKLGCEGVVGHLVGGPSLR